MKKMKFSAWLLIAVLAAGTVLSGCGRNNEVEEVEVVAEIIPIEDEEPEMQEIGDPQASLQVLLTNELGGTITGITIKKPDDAAYTANMMLVGQTIAPGETVRFFYEPVVDGTDLMAEGEIGVGPQLETESDLEDWDEEEDAYTEVDAVLDAWQEAQEKAAGTAATDAVEDVGAEEETVLVAEDDLDDEWETDLEDEEPDLGYFLQVTMEDMTIYEFTFFCMEDMEDVTLCYDALDEVAYLEYTSLSDYTLVSTKEIESVIKTNKDFAQQVTDLIAALDPVTAENAAAMATQVALIRSMYEDLTEAQRYYVTNLLHLEEAELALESFDVEEEETEEVEEQVQESTTTVKGETSSNNEEQNVEDPEEDPDSALSSGEDNTENEGDNSSEMPTVEEGEEDEPDEEWDD